METNYVGLDMKNIKFNEEVDAFINAVCSMTDEDRENEITNNYNSYLPSIPNGEHKKNMLMRLYDEYEEELGMEDPDAIPFYENELAWVRKPRVVKEERLLFCLLCQKKLHPHSSGWINLQFPTLLKYGFTSKEIGKVKLEDFSKCNKYGIKARVIGSNSPIVCFSIPIEPEGGSLYDVREKNLRSFFDEVVKR